jgi:hypothetical protein
VGAFLTELLPVRRAGREFVGHCPFHSESTPSFSVSQDNGKFYCFGCLKAGDVFDLVGHVWGINGLRAQLEAVANWGGLKWALDRLEGRDVPRARAPALISKSIVAAPGRKAIDRGEVEKLWSLCRPATDDPAVSDYLRSRNLDPAEIADRDLARALPERLALPPWASYQRTPWNRSHYRLVARLFNPSGEHASLTVRRIVAADDGMPKALFPPGPRTSLMLADDAGCWALRAPHDYLPSELWIAEGLTDLFALACDFSVCDEWAPGSLAIVGPNSWSQPAADRIPDRVTVVVAVDPDEAGDRYLAQIISTFKGRSIRIDRWKPRQERRKA